MVAVVRASVRKPPLRLLIDVTIHFLCTFPDPIKQIFTFFIFYIASLAILNMHMNVLKLIPCLESHAIFCLAFSYFQIELLAADIFLTDFGTHLFQFQLQIFSRDS